MMYITSYAYIFELPGNQTSKFSRGSILFFPVIILFMWGWLFLQKLFQNRRRARGRGGSGGGGGGGVPCLAGLPVQSYMAMEHPGLPKSDRLAANFQKCNNKFDNKLKLYPKNYFSALADQHDSPGKLPQALSRLVTSQQYIDTLANKEVKSIFSLEYTKHIIGKRSLVDMDGLLLQVNKSRGQRMPHVKIKIVNGFWINPPCH